MAEERTVINWKSDNLDTYLASKLYDIKLDLIKNSYEALGIPMPESKTIKSNKFIYDNEIVKENGMFSSHVSSGAAIVAMNRFSFGSFILPEEILKYIQDEYSINRANEKNLPSKEENFEDGLKVLKMFKELGYDDEASYALAGACWVESRWNCHAVNKDEVAGKNPNLKVSAGWNDAGEGYFQITFWKNKYKIIHELHPPQVTGDSEKGYSPNSLHLCDLDESWWTKITDYYLKNLKDHDSALRGTDIPTQLFASYLFKAAPGLKIDFDNVKKRTSQTMSGHKAMYGSLYHSYNGFVYQMLAAYVLAQYATGKKVSLKEIGIDFDANVKTSSGGRIKGILGKAFTNIVTGAKKVIDDLNVGVFKRNAKGWNIQLACNWIHTNSKATSQHACARFVRKAIEAGGISTSGRPNWAWHYISYLPSLGFKFLCKAKRNDPDYKPEPGDIAVYMKNGDRNVPGHICMWTGKNWCSDFKQNNMIVYSGTSEAYIFRFEDKNS